MPESAVRVVLLGAPGSGKGTQAERLSRALGVPAISTGEMLRTAVAEGSELGTKVGDVMAAGKLVDDALMAAVVAERLARADAARGFLLDGYPRNAGQVATLDELLGARELVLDAVLLLEVDEDVLVRRALARRRVDDREDVIRARLGIYHQSTEPLVDLYAERGILSRINGDRPIEAVTTDLLSAIGGAA